ncbi:MAG: phytoene/squalene synthase family protein [Planctomycetota bacterium]
MRYSQDLGPPREKIEELALEENVELPIKEAEDEHADESFEESILPGVSRTFALTIPQLPEDLRRVVRNYYLLCRIADTVEDEPSLSGTDKRRFHAELDAVLQDGISAEHFAGELYPLLSEETLPAERILIRETERVIRVHRSFSPEQRRAVADGLHVMNVGMNRFHCNRGVTGLSSLRELESYCYHVAGIVGEVLTELFCEHSAAIRERREELAELAVSFGQALQMTNILKDIWDDLAQGVCWLPRDLFAAHGIDLSELDRDASKPGFKRALGELIAVAHGHLRHALAYVQTIPKQEIGIRRFCFWAVGLAILTLRKIDRNRGFRSTAEAKIRRRTVRSMIAMTKLTRESRSCERWLFRLAGLGVPLADVAPSRASDLRIPE